MEQALLYIAGAIMMGLGALGAAVGIGPGEHLADVLVVRLAHVREPVVPPGRPDERMGLLAQEARQALGRKTRSSAMLCM